MKELEYYLPTSSQCLGHYFGCACIKPSKYFENKPEDIQNIADSFLLLSDKIENNPTDCCLELVLTSEEKQDVIPIGNGLFLFEKPLPITRIKKIHFSNREQKDVTITNIRMSTAFIPDSIIDVTPFESKPIGVIKEPSDCYKPGLREKIELFNRFLGALALMRTAHEDYMNFSERYIDTVAFFNSKIRKELLALDKTIDERFSGLFAKSNSYSTLLPYLSKKISETDLEEIANKEQQIIQKDKFSRVIDLSSLDKNTYIVAFLDTFGVGSESKRKKIDGLIISNFNSDEIKKEKAEGIALCYGYNRGYNVFTNAYGLSAEGKQPVKFELKSQLDYYIIESVYQYIFNDEIVSQDFPYLDSWCPKLDEKPRMKNEYKILDTVIIGKKKPKVFGPEWWNGLWKNFPGVGEIFKETIQILFAKFGSIVYEDTKDEIEEEYLDKENRHIDIEDNLTRELDSKNQQLKKIEQEIIDYQQLIHKLESENKKQNYSQEEINSSNIVSENQAPYNSINKEEKRKLIQEILRYSNLKSEELSKLIKAKGLKVPKTKDEKVLLLMEYDDLSQSELFKNN